MKMISLMPILALTAMMTGCDRVTGHDFAADRADAHYRAAMVDFAGGRIKKAIAGLEKAIEVNPMNASARFQLACLLQDHDKDYIGAICQFREYRILCPRSDKAKIAVERENICRNMIKALAVADGEEGQSELSRQIDTLQRKVSELQKEKSELERSLKDAQEESARLRKLVAAVDDAEDDVRPDKIKVNEKDLLDEASDRSKQNTELDDIIREGGEEVSVAPISGGNTRKKPVAQPKSENNSFEYYTVRPGDTLYRIAERFYGSKSQWKRIREANKSTISSDGRIKPGQQIILPK